MEQEFVDKVAVVTGGSRGMGREVVRALARRGTHVVIASRKLPPCEEIAEEMRTTYGVRAIAVATNVSEWSDCDALVEAAYAEFGRVDILVNNAGSSPLYPSLAEIEQQLFDKVMAVNLRGPFRLSSLVGTRMAEQGGGSIINIGSVEAIRPSPQALPYALAKAGLHTMTEGMAQAFGPKVRVNTVQHGAFLTEISDGWPEGMREQLEQKVALKRCAQADEIVGAVLYLAGSQSTFTTGSCLRVDGGWL